MRIIEELIPKSWQLALLESMQDVTWIHQKGTSYQTVPTNFVHGMDVFVDENTIDSIQFVHYAILQNDRSFMFSYLRPLTYMIEDAIDKTITRIHRIKINHQSPIPNFNKDNYNIPHVDDVNYRLWTLIYYINDSDGDTFLFNEHYPTTGEHISKLTLLSRITPKMGKAIVFPSTQFHAGSNPINSPGRYVINITFEVKE